jgi:hypothetical protein
MSGEQPDMAAPESAETDTAKTGKGSSWAAALVPLATIIIGARSICATPPAEVMATLRLRAPKTSDQLQAVVDHLQLLIFEAYDGLGYVFWRP